MKFNSIPGPRNWQPRALTAAQRLEESCWGFWCWRMSSVTVRSPKDRAARMARILPSSSTSWQWTRVTSFLCIGRLRTLWVVLFRPTPLKESRKLFLGLQCNFRGQENFLWWADWLMGMWTVLGSARISKMNNKITQVKRCEAFLEVHKSCYLMRIFLTLNVPLLILVTEK